MVAFEHFRTANVQKNHLMEFLEFESEDLPFFDAFPVPKGANDGMTRVGRKGEAKAMFPLFTTESMD